MIDNSCSFLFKTIKSPMTKTCKYCLQSGGKMVQPCSCKDYVHRTCLQKWYETKGVIQESTNFDKDSTTPNKNITTPNPNICEICHTEYARGEVFKCGNCLWDWTFYSFLILLNLFIFIGYAGYDQIGKSASLVNQHNDSNYDDDSSDDNDSSDDSDSNNDPSPFDSFLFAMLIIGIVGFMIVNVICMFIGKQHFEFSPRKQMLFNLLVNVIMQAIPVAIYSAITGEFFWNVTTYGMSATTIASIIASITIVGVLLVLIGGVLYECISASIKCTRKAYTTEEFVNTNHV